MDRDSLIRLLIERLRDSGLTFREIVAYLIATKVCQDKHEARRLTKGLKNDEAKLKIMDIITTYMVLDITAYVLLPTFLFVLFLFERYSIDKIDLAGVLFFTVLGLIGAAIAAVISLSPYLVPTIVMAFAEENYPRRLMILLVILYAYSMAMSMGGVDFRDVHLSGGIGQYLEIPLVRKVLAQWIWGVVFLLLWALSAGFRKLNL